MPIQFETRKENGYIRIIPTGRLETLDELIEYGTYMYDQAIACDIHRVLLDEKDLIDAADASTIYEWCENEVVSKTATSGIRIAGVCTADNFACNKVYETMFQNRSYNFRVFLNEEEAIQWLTS